MIVEAGRRMLALLAGKARRAVGQQRGEGSLAGGRVPPLLSGLDPTGGKRRVGPLLVQRTSAQAREVGNA